MTRRPVCYVLEDYGLSNALILERACREAGLPSPLQPMPGDPLGRKRSYVCAVATAARARWPRRIFAAATRAAGPGGAGARQDPFGNRWSRCSTRIAPNAALDVQTGAGVDLRRPRAEPRAAAGSACCSRKTGRWSAASAACWRSCSTAATPWCTSRRRYRRCAASSGEGPPIPNARCASSRACCARTSRRIRAAVIGSGPVDGALLVGRGAGRRAGARGDRRPGGATRQDQPRSPPGRRRTSW